MTMPDYDTAVGWVDARVVDTAGEEIGTSTNLYTDDATGVPEWLLVRIADGSQVLVPVVDARDDNGRVRVAVARPSVLAAPRVGTDGHVTEQQEMTLYDHYGIPHSTDTSATVLPVATSPAPERRTAAPAAGAVPPAGAAAAGEAASAAGAAPARPGPGPVPVWSSDQAMRSRRIPYLAAAGGAGVMAAAALGLRRWRAAQTLSPRARLVGRSRDLGGSTARGTMTTAALGVMAGQALAEPAARLRDATLRALSGAISEPGPTLAHAPGAMQQALGRSRVARTVLVALAGFAAGYAVRGRSQPGVVVAGAEGTPPGTREMIVDLRLVDDGTTTER